MYRRLVLVLGLVGAVALSLAFAIASISCGGAGSSLKAWSGAFAGCEKEDLGQLVQSGDVQMTLLSDVASLIEGNATTLESDLGKLAVSVGIEAVHCAIMAAEGVLAPPQVGVATRVVPPGLVRAKAWLASQQKGSAK